MRLPPFRGNVRPHGQPRINYDSPQADGLLSLWSMQSRMGSSGLALSGFVPYASAHGIGHRVDWNGGLVTSPTAVALDRGTLAFWVIPHLTSSSLLYGFICDSAGARHALVKTGYNTRNDEFEWYVNGRSSLWTIAYPPQVPIHLAAVYDKATDLLLLYLNGRLAAQNGSKTGTWGSTPASDFRVGIGNVNNLPWDGVILEARTYSVPLSSVAVAQLAAPETCWDLYAHA